MYHLILLASAIAAPVLQAIGPDTTLRQQFSNIVRQRRAEVLKQRAAILHRLKIRLLKHTEARALLADLVKPTLLRNDSTHEVQFANGSRLRLEIAMSREVREHAEEFALLHAA